MSFDITPKTVLVTKESTAGSKVATVRILVDTVTLNNTTMLSLWQSFTRGLVKHNNSGMSLKHYHNSGPFFKLVPSNNSPNPTVYSYYLRYNSTTIAKLRELLPVYCTNKLQSITAISFDMYLLSNSFYHLGDHTIVFWVNMVANNSYYEFLTILNLRVEAGINVTE